MTMPATQKIIAIASAKGGVGKTYLTLNLGIHCAALGSKVLLVDGSLQLPALSELNVDDFNVVKPDDTAPLIDGLSAQFNDVDIVLIDTGPSIGSSTCLLIQAAYRVVLVITPQYGSLMAAAKQIEHLHRQFGLNEFDVVLNHAVGKKSHTVWLERLYQQLITQSGVVLRFLGTINEAKTTKELLNDDAANAEKLSALAQRLVSDAVKPPQGRMEYCFSKRIMEGAHNGCRNKTTTSQ